MKNQCDGCQAGKPLLEDRYHDMGEGVYRDLMVCERSKYEGSDYGDQPHPNRITSGARPK